MRVAADLWDLYGICLGAGQKIGSLGIRDESEGLASPKGGRCPCRKY